MPVAIYFIILLAVWPVLGLLLLKWVDRYRRNRDAGSGVPPVQSFGDLMIHFYAWPILLLFLWWQWRKTDYSAK